MTPHADPVVRTSVSHPLYVDWLDAPSRVGLTFAPGKRCGSTRGYRWERDLDLDLAALRRAGVTVLVSLLEEHELAANGIVDLYARAKAIGLEVLQLPIRDQGTPAEMGAVDALLDTIEARESSGGRVVIHCLGGLGRTGTVAGCYLVRRGAESKDALAELRRVRKDDLCPENEAQRRYVASYATHHAAKPRATALAHPASVSAPASATGPVGPAAPRYARVLAGLGAGGAIASVGVGAGRKAAVAALLDRIEREIIRSPAKCFELADDGHATLTAADRTFAAGRFTTPTLGELRARLAARAGVGSGRLVLSVFHGTDPLTDIGTLQAFAEPGTLFQVASQFNCLEAPGPHIVPVRDYVTDNTQGPRAAVSAFPATFLRHYSAPTGDGERFVQTDDRCLDMLSDVFDSSVAVLRSGYLRTANVRDPGSFARALVDRLDHVRVGVHDDVDVVFGHDWGGPLPEGAAPRIAQVFASTMALDDAAGKGGAAIDTARRQLLRAAYLGTLLAAVDLGKTTVVLTLIGGGVFANPHRDIWDAIHWALAETEPFLTVGLTVVVNAREQEVGEADRAKVRARGGVFVTFSSANVVVTR